MKSRRNRIEPIGVEGSLKKVSMRAKPVMKRIAKGAAVICVSLTVNSLGAVANETINKAGVAAKAAKSAKSSSKMAKKAADIGSALLVCANARVGAENAAEAVAAGKGSKPFIFIVFGVVWVCGLMCGRAIYEGD